MTSANSKGHQLNVVSNPALATEAALLEGKNA
jgi:hypothetical protein